MLEVAVRGRCARSVRRAILAASALAGTVGSAQTTTADTAQRAWSGDVEAYTYLLGSESYLLTIARADLERLHLEARSQYEARHTLSVWIGWRFTSGRRVQLLVSPIGGAIVGRLAGFAVGLEATVTWRSLTLYNESEYVFDVRGREGSFYYNWTNLAWQARDWLMLGPSTQRTRARGDFSFDVGAFIGVQHSRMALTLYGFNLNRHSRFGIVALQVEL